jgi:hypothetical protein
LRASSPHPGPVDTNALFSARFRVNPKKSQPLCDQTQGSGAVFSLLFG